MSANDADKVQSVDEGHVQPLVMDHDSSTNDSNTDHPRLEEKQEDSTARETSAIQSKSLSTTDEDPADVQPSTLEGHRGGSDLSEDAEAGMSHTPSATTAKPSLLKGDIEDTATPTTTETAAVTAVPLHDKPGVRSPPPPPPPPKNAPVPGFSTAPAQNEGEYDEKDAIPEITSPAGQDDARSEIEDIMGQFSQEGGGPGEEEVMTPRFEKTPSLYFPRRESSLDPEYQSSPNSPALQRTLSRDSYKFTPSKARPPSVSGSLHVPLDSPGRAGPMSPSSPSVFQPPPPEPDPEPPLPFDFHRFLEQLRHRTADPVARFLRSFLNEFGKKQWAVHEQVKIISDFLEFIAKKMAQCEVWRTVSDAEFDNAKEGMEKLVMNRLYSQTFSPAIPPVEVVPKLKNRRTRPSAASNIGPGRRGQHEEDVERDQLIAEKIRIYSWIREEHLDIPSLGEKGRKFLTLAQQEILKINSYRAPRDKVIQILNCCKVIFGFLKNNKTDQSADAFVPLLIYTVLKANPAHLASNVQYILRFRNQDKLGGEAGYYISSLMGVISFVETLDRTNLTITNEEFEAHVEAAVSAIAEDHRAEEYEAKTSAAGPVADIPEASSSPPPAATPQLIPSSTLR